MVYINLDKRTDRRAEMEAEFKRLGIPEDKIIRRSGIEMDPGILGAGMSHTAVMRYIESLPQNIQTVIVFEDDFQFIDDVSLVKNSIQKFLTYPRDIWDMVLLSYGVRRSQKYDDLVSRTFESYLASGYMINRAAVPRILENFAKGCEGLSRTGYSGFFIDNYWNHLMATGRCFYFNKHLGFQRSSWSDVDKTVISRPSTDHTRA